MIGQRIKQVRVENQLTMDEFGKKLPRNPTRSAVSRWESGKSLPNSERLDAIAKLGGFSVDYLLTGVVDLDASATNWYAKERQMYVSALDSFSGNSLTVRTTLINITNSIFNLLDHSMNIDQTERLLLGWSYQFRNFTKIETPTELETEGFKSLTMKLIDSLNEQNKNSKK